MPSPEHAVLVDLFRMRPELVPLLLYTVGIAAPSPGISFLESTFPVAVPDFQVDLAVLLGEPNAPTRVVVLLEVQLAIDDDKPHRWLLYQAAAQDRHRCSVAVVVMAPDLRVAEWAQRRHTVGLHDSYAPTVLGPLELRALTDVEAARRMPELAVLAALALDRHHPDVRILRAAGEAISTIEDEDRSRLYFDLLESKLGDAFVAAVEGIMIHGEPLSDRAKAYYREGEAKGKTAGLADALLRILAARSLEATTAQRATILACKDIATLECWVEQAVHARSVSELLSQS
jgi:hypothetical protein